MKIKLGASKIVKPHYKEVSSLAEASEVLSAFITRHDCVAGCGSQDFAIFLGGEVYEGKKQIAKVSYNGRIWDLEGKEIVL